MQHRISRLGLSLLVMLVVFTPARARGEHARDPWHKRNSRDRFENVVRHRKDRDYDRWRRARIEQVRRNRIANLRRIRLEQIRRARIERIRHDRAERIRRARLEEILRARRDRCDDGDWRRVAGRGSRDQLEQILLGGRYGGHWDDDSDSRSRRSRRVADWCTDRRSGRRPPIVVHDPRNWPDRRVDRRYLVSANPAKQAAALRALNILTSP
ncbi:MAG: hypothetical protein ACRENP_08420 [Longimicrobiales bacterium]